MNRIVNIRFAQVVTMLLLFLLGTRAMQAQTTVFTYQGKLTDAGSPANGDYDLQFKLFDALSGGAQQGSTQILNPVTASAGLFTVTLDFGATVFSGAARYLEIGVRPASSANPYTVLGPRQTITSTPFAIQSLNAAALSSACVACVTGAQIGSLPTNSGNYIQNSATLQATSTFNVSGNGFIGGNVGIGTTTPGNKLDVNGQATFRTGGSGGGLIGVGTPNSETGLTISGNGTTRADLRFDGSTLKLVATGAGIPQATSGLAITTSGSVSIGGASPDPDIKLYVNSPDDVPVYGDTAYGIGVFGNSTTYIGVEGKSVNGFGVYAESNSATAVYGQTQGGSGVYGSTAAASVNKAGVYGQGYGSGSIGVIGQSDSGNAVGVYGASASSTGFGVYAHNFAGGYALYAEGSPGYAAYFSGKVHVTGVIEKAGGGFKIDHPLDPENKYLVHSFVESPDMKNLYDGTVITDANGEADITLPDWFAALNRDFRYQLTCIGVFAQAIIAEEITDGRFKIRTSMPQVKVSWQVTGIRQDAWANENRLPVEELKPAEERGSYQNPSAFGQPEERSTEWAINPAMMKKQKEERERLQREQNNKAAAPAVRRALDPPALLPR